MVNDATAAVEAAVAGEGVTMMMSYVVVDLIKSGKLVPVLMGFVPEVVPVHLVFPQSRLVAPKLRAFLDFSATRLKAELMQLAL
jgi:DNA-binding transcriptional LysR family regulator